ncbi:MAG TPA: tetratricopeptide repeat protein [Vicinamibacterales bacterium]|nr:tetratricopeptide repeat protein [Vicinamibacterales bacterium]
MKRTLLLAALLLAYAWTGLQGFVLGALHRNRFDPFLPLARRLEQRVEERRFADALPIALELEKTYPEEPLVAYWIGRIRNGLGDRAAEAAAWERYVAISPTPEEACPAWPEAIAATRGAADALDAFARCAAYDPTGANRLVDLGDAQLRAGRADDARETFRKAAVIDPDDPLIASRMQTAGAHR